MSGEHRRLTTDSDFARCLIEAAKGGDLILVKKLPGQNAPVDYQDNLGRTTLMKAIWFDKLEIIRELIKADASLDIQDKGGCTALIPTSGALGQR